MLRVSETAIDDSRLAEARMVAPSRQVVDRVLEVRVARVQKQFNVLHVIGAISGFDALGRERHHDDSGRDI